MANLTLIYGMRLLPSEEAVEVGDALVTLKNGKQAHVTMHVLEGSREQIENQLRQSIEAFFDFYPRSSREPFARGLYPKDRASQRTESV